MVACKPHARAEEGDTAYNLPVVISLFLLPWRAVRRLAAGAAIAMLCALFPAVYAHGQPGGGREGVSAGGGGTGSAFAGSRVLLVLPFDNRTGQPSLEWIREAAAEILSSRFASAGFQPTSRADRHVRAGPSGAAAGLSALAGATSLKLAQTLDADSIVVGSYATDGSGIVAEAHAGGRAAPAHAARGDSARGEMKDLIAVFGELAWKLTSSWTPSSTWPRRRLWQRGKGIRWTRSSSTFAESRSRTRRNGCGTCRMR